MEITKKADKSGKAFDGRNGNQIQDWMTKFDLFGPSIICRWCYKKLYIKKKKLEKANHTSSQAPRPKIAKFTTIPIYRFNIFAPNWDINPCTGVHPPNTVMDYLKYSEEMLSDQVIH